MSRPRWGERAHDPLEQQELFETLEEWAEASRPDGPAGVPEALAALDELKEEVDRLDPPLWAPGQVLVRELSLAILQADAAGRGPEDLARAAAAVLHDFGRATDAMPAAWKVRAELVRAGLRSLVGRDPTA